MKSAMRKNKDQNQEITVEDIRAYGKKVLSSKKKAVDCYNAIVIGKK